MKKEKLIISIIAIMMLTISVVSAGSIARDLYTHKNTTSNIKHLGSGTHTLKAEAVEGSGSAYAMKVIKMWPDKAVADVSVSGKKIATDTFSAQDKTDDGIKQSYYILWAPDGLSKAYISIYD